ncbi:MAG TPA: SDR family oxidoreductase [Rugosimonospora sp.]|nr:SDR family oxidoreductase [Rugosimonospora sp.]
MSAALFSLAGRTALITGAGRGIGQALAVGLAEAGADVVLCGRPGSSHGTAERLRATGRLAGVVDLDLGDPAAVRASAATLATRYPVDVLVNNAGVIDRGDARDVTAENWSAVLDVDLSSLFFLCQRFGAAMVGRGSGKIVNIASLLSFQGGLRVVSYAAAKHAVLGVTRALATEWAPHGVQVNAVAPGYIATDNTQPLRADPVRYRQISERIPVGRWGTPQDLVGAVVFLAAPASDYVTGQVIVVDGGWLAR